MAQTKTLEYPGQSVLEFWAGKAPVGGFAEAENQAQVMYAGDPAALTSAAASHQAVADGLTGVHADLQATAAQAAGAWHGESGTSFVTATRRETAAQVDQARQSAAGLAARLNDKALLVGDMKTGTAAACGLTAVALSTLQQNDPQAIPVAQQDLTQWVSTIGALFAKAKTTDPALATAVAGAGAQGGPALAGGAATGAGGGGAGGGGTAGGGGAAGGGGGNGLGGGGVGGGAGGDIGPAEPVNGNVDQWITQALTAMGMPDTPDNHNALRIIIQGESSGNPNAVAGSPSDPNVAAGNPTIGLTQTLPSTFSAYMLTGHGDIRNPVDNIIAGVRYAQARYGGLDNVPGVQAVRAAGGNMHAYVGY